MQVGLRPRAKPSVGRPAGAAWRASAAGANPAIPSQPAFFAAPERFRRPIQKDQRVSPRSSAPCRGRRVPWTDSSFGRNHHASRQRLRRTRCGARYLGRSSRGPALAAQSGNGPTIGGQDQPAGVAPLLGPLVRSLHEPGEERLQSAGDRSGTGGELRPGEAQRGRVESHRPRLPGLDAPDRRDRDARRPDGGVHPLSLEGAAIHCPTQSGGRRLQTTIDPRGTGFGRPCSGRQSVRRGASLDRARRGPTGCASRPQLRRLRRGAGRSGSCRGGAVVRGARSGRRRVCTTAKSCRSAAICRRHGAGELRSSARRLCATARR